MKDILKRVVINCEVCILKNDDSDKVETVEDEFAIHAGWCKTDDEKYVKMGTDPIWACPKCRTAENLSIVK